MDSQLKIPGKHQLSHCGRVPCCQHRRRRLCENKLFIHIYFSLEITTHVFVLLVFVVVFLIVKSSYCLSIYLTLSSITCLCNILVNYYCEHVNDMGTRYYCF